MQETTERKRADLVHDALQFDKPTDIFIGERVHELLLRLPQVCSLTALSRATIYRKIGTGMFPKPYQASENARVWKLSEIEAWMAGLKQAA